jgi:hypothetical protein
VDNYPFLCPETKDTISGFVFSAFAKLFKIFFAFDGGMGGEIGEGSAWGKLMMFDAWDKSESRFKLDRKKRV